MPEEFDVGGAADAGSDGGGDSGGPEPSSEGAQASGGTSAGTPSYMTREQFEEAMAAYGQSHQERLDKVAGSFGSVEALVRQLVESQKPQPPPLVPDAKSLENIDAHGMRELLQAINGKHEATAKELREQIERMNREWKQRTEAERIHGYFKSQMETISKQHKALQSQVGQRLLEDLVIAGMQKSNGNHRAVNVAAIGQSLASWIEGEVKSRMTEAAKAAAAQGNVQGKGAAAPRSPAKGAPTKPGENPGAGVNLKNFREKARAMIEANFPTSRD